MNGRTKLGIAAAAVAVVAATGFTAASDDDKPLSGESLDRAVAAALEHTGGGEVTETEVGDDGAAYEVEVMLADGRQVEVQLDESYSVTGTENDDDGANDD